MLVLLGFGCLIDRDLYEQRRAALLDADGDGFDDAAQGGDDCDDADGAAFPGATEVPYDAVDQDCDGADLADVDGDGFDAEAAGGTDCDDGDAGVFLGAVEEPYDAIDQDCDGADLDDVDADGDADESVGGSDCDDGDPSVYGGAAETWANGFTDNDCDGELEGASLAFGTDTWFGATPGANAGARVAPLGDLVGGGTAAFLVAAVYDASAFANGGAVYVVPDADGGPLADVPSITAGGPDWYTGTGLDGGVDIDDDGIPDLLVGATGMDSGAGGAFVLSGANVGGGARLPDDARALLQGNGAATYAGAQTVFLDDTDGDGLPEVAVSAPFETVDGLAQAGRVYVVPGGVEGVSALAAAADLVWDGYFTGGALGNTVQPAGDQNGDGLPDVLVAMEAGVAAWIVPGGGAGGTIQDLAAFALYNPDDAVITDAKIIGDLDGDGKRDLVVYGPQTRTFIDLTGTPSRLLETGAYATFADDDESAVYDATDLGDLDGDGLAETLLSVPWLPAVSTGWLGVVPGSAWHLGESLDPGSLSLSAVSVRPDSGAGFRARVVGDLDGSGGSSLAVSALHDDEGGVDAGGVVVVPVPE
jgi:hypothetical protein